MTQLVGKRRALLNNQWFASITADLSRFMTDFRNGLTYITAETGAAIDEITGSVGDSSGTCGEYVSTFFNNFFSLLKIGVTMVTAAVMSVLKTIKAAIATAGTALISFSKSAFNVLTEKLAPFIIGNECTVWSSPNYQVWGDWNFSKAFMRLI